MALTSTIYNFTIELADVDRGVYESLDLRVAMHPSESAEYMVTRVLAYCLEFTEGIEFTAGLSNGEEPAIVVRDLTGCITVWIEIGMPDADRLHRASKAAERVALYTHRDIRNVLSQLDGRRIHRAADIPIYAFERPFIEELASLLDRRVTMSLSVTEKHLYLDVGERSLTSVLDERRLVSP